MSRSLLFAACLLAVAAMPARADWHFAIPDGWSDVSPGKPVPKGVPEEISDIAQGGTYHTYAIDLAGARHDHFAENLNAIVQQRPVVADATSLAQWVASIPAQAAQEAPGSTAKVIEQSVASIGGVPVLRIVVDVETAETKMRSLQYMIPGGSSTAQLTYSSSEAEFAQYLPVFEAAAQKTQGAAAPPVAARLGHELLATGVSAEDWQTIFGVGGKLLGAGLLIILGLVLAVRNKRKKLAAG